MQCETEVGFELGANRLPRNLVSFVMDFYTHFSNATVRKVEGYYMATELPNGNVILCNETHMRIVGGRYLDGVVYEHKHVHTPFDLIVLPNGNVVVLYEQWTSSPWIALYHFQVFDKNLRILRHSSSFCSYFKSVCSYHGKVLFASDATKLKTFDPETLRFEKWHTEIDRLKYFGECGTYHVVKTTSRMLFYNQKSLCADIDCNGSHMMCCDNRIFRVRDNHVLEELDFQSWQFEFFMTLPQVFPILHVLHRVDAKQICFETNKSEFYVYYLKTKTLQSFGMMTGTLHLLKQTGYLLWLYYVEELQ